MKRDLPITLLRLTGPDLMTWIRDQEGYGIYKRLKYLFPDSAWEETHYFAEGGPKSRLIGVLSVLPSPTPGTL